MSNARDVPQFEEGIVSGGASSNLDDFTTGYVEHNVTEPEGVAIATRGAPSVADVIDMTRLARRAPMWDSIFFGIIHVIPRVKDLGSVISATNYLVEIWNADEASHLGTGYTIAGSSGVTLSGGPTWPAFIAPFSSAFVTVNVDDEGDPVINTLITWLFPGFTGVDHRLLGVRITIFPTEPDWPAKIEERFGYLTDVFRSRNLSEQRRQLRSLPVQELTYTAVAPDPKTAGDVLARLFSGGQFLFGVPYWPDASPLTAAVSAGATVIPVNTTGTTFAPGGLVALWRDGKTWETATIAAAGVAPSALTLTGAISSSWPLGGTVVVPIVGARLLAAAELDTDKPEAVVVRATFTTEPV